MEPADSPAMTSIMNIAPLMAITIQIAVAEGRIVTGVNLFLMIMTGWCSPYKDHRVLNLIQRKGPNRCRGGCDASR